MNNEAKHTPGPWKYIGLYTDPIITGSDGKAVIQLADDGGCSDPECCGGPSYHIEIDDVDARLIAAAPELLAALKQALDESGCDGDLCMHNWHEVARTAIAKATEQ